MEMKSWPMATLDFGAVCSIRPSMERFLAPVTTTSSRAVEPVDCAIAAPAIRREVTRALVAHRPLRKDLLI